MTTTPSPILTVFLSLAIVAMIPLAAWGVWSGWSTIQADRRMQASGLTAPARITRIDAGRGGTVSNRAAARSASVYYLLEGEPGAEPGAERRVSVGRALAPTLTRGEAITLRVDPANPDRRMLDRDHEVRLAWLFLAGFGALGLMALALLVWMLRGGLTPGPRAG